MQGKLFYVFSYVLIVIGDNSQHHFHQKCLDEAKAMKAECPMCRCPLSPLPDSQATLYPSLMRSAISSAAARGRNAVRYLMYKVLYFK